MIYPHPVFYLKYLQLKYIDKMTEFIYIVHCNIKEQDIGKLIKDDIIEVKRNENVGTQSEQRDDTLRDIVLTLTYIVLTI